MNEVVFSQTGNTGHRGGIDIQDTIAETINQVKEHFGIDSILIIRVAFSRIQITPETVHRIFRKCLSLFLSMFKIFKHRFKVKNKNS